ncbi:Uncharacterized protein DAT39_006719 [Clarias magur]|uniref:Uncharacterized protein n=1 Tax=Clarias magur TaxID=1594786 RepID=A0A8J4U3R1_CLAMG|nr:Uncharacterized protein DAT39_006719 [Clarias magur]
MDERMKSESVDVVEVISSVPSCGRWVQIIQDLLASRALKLSLSPQTAPAPFEIPFGPNRPLGFLRESNCEFNLGESAFI